MAGPAQLGPFTQLGFVVRDIEAAMRHYRDVLGVGPFLFLENGTGRPPSTTFHRGEAVTVETRLAFAFMGEVELELIEQVNDAPSPYREFLDDGREGLQHFGYWVDDHAGACESVEAAGYRRAYEIPVAGEADPIVYYEARSPLGAMLELVPPAWQRSRAAVKAHLERHALADTCTFESYGAFLSQAGAGFD